MGKPRKRTPKEVIRVSDHAIIRYLERVKGVDISEIKREILTPEICEYVSTLGGSGKFPAEEGFHIVMRNNTVITVVKDE